MPEGVDLLDAALAGLRAVAVAGGWSGADSARLARCLVDAPREPGQVVERIDAERARLGSLRAGLDLEAVAHARMEAVHLALVDAEPETLLARKYEAATERALYRALREIRAARRPAPPPFAPAAELGRQADEMRRHRARVEPAPVAASPPLGSSFPEALDVSAAGPKSTTTGTTTAPHGRSRFEDRRRRPKLGR